MATRRSYSLTDYREAVYTDPWVDDIPTTDLRPAREWLADHPPKGTLAELDAIVVEEVVTGDEVPASLLADDPVQPMEKWWWHLGALRRGDYSADYLPAPLRSVYLDALSARLLGDTGQ